MNHHQHHQHHQYSQIIGTTKHRANARPYVEQVDLLWNDVSVIGAALDQGVTLPKWWTLSLCPKRRKPRNAYIYSLQYRNPNRSKS